MAQPLPGQMLSARAETTRCGNHPSRMAAAQTRLWGPTITNCAFCKSPWQRLHSYPNPMSQVFFSQYFDQPQITNTEPILLSKWNFLLLLKFSYPFLFSLKTWWMEMFYYLHWPFCCTSCPLRFLCCKVIRKAYAKEMTGAFWQHFASPVVGQQDAFGCRNYDLRQ